MEVCCQGDWSSNGLCFATAAEAEAYGQDLLSRWFVPTASRAVPCQEPVNRVWDFAQRKALDLPVPPTPVADEAEEHQDIVSEFARGDENWQPGHSPLSPTELARHLLSSRAAVLPKAPTPATMPKRPLPFAKK